MSSGRVIVGLALILAGIVTAAVDAHSGSAYTAAGTAGPQGPAGASGAPGSTGATGSTGAPGSNGADGADGVAGWDWASPEYEQAGDSLSDVALADWPDAATAGAVSSVCRVDVLSRVIRLSARYQSDCSTDYTTTNRSMGILRSIAAGDFRVGMRYLVARPGVAIAATSSILVGGPVFVDGADPDTASWYGVAYYLSGSTTRTADIYSFKNEAGAHRFDAYDGGYALQSGGISWTEVDVFLERIGTTLNVYMGPVRSPGWLYGTFTVTAGAGLIGLRSQVLNNATDELDLTLTAYRAGLASLPW